METFTKSFVIILTAIFCVAMLMVAVGCGKKTKYKTIEPDVINTLVDIEAFTAVDGCKSGGTVVTSGTDLDDNGVLDASEVEKREIVCTKQYIVKSCKKKKHKKDKDDDDSESSDD